MLKLLNLLLALEEDCSVRVLARGDFLKAYKPLTEGPVFGLLRTLPRTDLFRLVERVKFDLDEQCFVVYCDRCR